MNDDDLFHLLRAGLPPAREAPPRDLWPDVVDRLDARVRWSAVDFGLAAFASVVLLLFPEGLWLVAFHL
jgi:hypothetical protein